jgi:hypothetical protein
VSVVYRLSASTDTVLPAGQYSTASCSFVVFLLPNPDLNHSRTKSCRTACYHTLARLL